MFVRIKKSGKYQYLQLAENRREGLKIKQRVIGTLGRMDILQHKGEVENIIKSLSKYSGKVLMVLNQKSNFKAETKRLGPSLIFERLWNESGIKKIIRELLTDRKYGFDIERAIYLTVLHRLLISGSDRSCDRWRRDYVVEGEEDLSLHHFYRAMAFLGEETEDQRGKTPFSPRCIKDIVEEKMFAMNRDLFTELNIVFFDTTTLYFEGEGGDSIGQKGNSKDHRPEENQMVVGAVLDANGRPLSCEMWPGNTADVKTLLPVTNRLRSRFHVNRFCIVADRGMISQDTIDELEKRDISYILGARMRKVKQIREEVLSRAGRYKEVYPESKFSKDTAPLKVKEVFVNGRRYIVCLNERQAKKDDLDRQIIIEGLKDKLKHAAKSLIGNKGYRKYLKMDKGTLTIDQDKIEQEAKYDGKWVLKTNSGLTAEEVALKYKELWQVEQVFRDVKCILETRPIYHKTDETIRGHVFCSFLALVLRKELVRRLDRSGYNLEWSHIKQDLESMEQVIIEEKENKIAIRTECKGACSKIFKSVGVAIPPTISRI